MTINVTFENIEEMKVFAETVLGSEKADEKKEATRTAMVPLEKPSELAKENVAERGNVTSSVTGGVQTTETVYTIDDLARAAMTLMDAGKQTELQQLLAGYGVEALPMLPKNQYGLFATGLRSLGAQI